MQTLDANGEFVCGTQVPADRKVWVCLQFHAGETWVPDLPQRVMSLFLLPDCVFLDPGVEDIMLCPECVQSMRNFTK